MSDYTERSCAFFLHSLTYLKRQSGGQRWNDICSDTVDLFFTTFPPLPGGNPFTRETLWRFLFDPPTDPGDELHSAFASLCTHELFVRFFFLILHSLLDPPSHWWRNSFTTATN